MSTHSDQDAPAQSGQNGQSGQTAKIDLTALPDADTLERLSALVDGELDAAAARRACSHWRDDHAARGSWHAYQLIGDVLRSEDLACTSARDTAFLAAFRVRLLSEPVVLAPQALETFGAAPASGVTGVAGVAPDEWVAPLQSAGGLRRNRRAGIALSAVAASFVAVAVVLVMNHGRPGEAPALQAALDLPLVARVTPGSPATRAGAQAPTPDAEPPAVVADGQLIRSARLDRYLAAHKQFAGSSALGVPSGFLRNATATESDR